MPRGPGLKKQLRPSTIYCRKGEFSENGFQVLGILGSPVSAKGFLGNSKVLTHLLNGRKGAEDLCLSPAYGETDRVV